MPDVSGSLTWSDIKESIAFRLNRPTLPRTFIQLIAQERVQIMESEGFWPSQVTNITITTEPGQYFYVLPSGTTKVLFVRVLLGGSSGGVWIPVFLARHYEDMLIADPVAPPFTAIPTTARVFGQMLRLFPTPNAQYVLELTLDKRIDVPTDDQDTTNFWVDEGRALIVNRVCEHLCLELLRDPDRAAFHKTVADEAMDSLTEISHARNGPHLMRRS
jgi:hypothetical protein